MTQQGRIALAPETLTGKPVVRGTRLSVEFIVGLFAEGWSETDILDNYPTLSRDNTVLVWPTHAIGLRNC